MAWPLTTIISGGQTGADRAGLDVGKVLGYLTGGMVPAGCRTEDGPRPDLLTAFSMQESASRAYTPRTWWNIMHSDGTLIFTGDGYTTRLLLTGGSADTARICEGNHKPHRINPDIYLYAGQPRIELIQPVRAWIMDCHIQTLNIAGNRESKSPGIHDRVMAFLVEALRKP